MPFSKEDESRLEILLVDDHRANLLALEAVLEPLGYALVSASSGAEALRLLDAHEFVLIFMDVHMAGLDGFETVEHVRLREGGRHVPVIFITAVHDQPEHLRRGYELGALDFISKPFDADVVRGKARAIVNLYARGQEIERARGRELDRLKDLFLGTVGHDLRNPLQTINMAAKLLDVEHCPDSSRRGFAQKIGRAGARMGAMIEDILDLTRSQFTGRIPVTVQTMDLHEVARAAVDELLTGNPGRDVTLEAMGSTRGEWDPGRMARVVSNLVGNAIQHTTQDPVRVTLVGETEVVTLVVHNRGEPIPAETLPRLFEPFRRGDTSAQGLGLGLYIVREVVKAHRGTVGVTSTDADGTTFTVHLPRGKAL